MKRSLLVLTFLAGIAGGFLGGCSKDDGSEGMKTRSGEESQHVVNVPEEDSTPRAVKKSKGGLLGSVKAKADNVAEAYGETWNSFYGDGHYKNLMTASLDMRPDGTPNIVLDEAAGKMTVTIRLAVNEANYKAWKNAAHKRFVDANMSFRFSDFEDPGGRMIGGKNYRFGDNEEASIKRWEAKEGNGYKAKLSVRVELVDKAGKVLCDDLLPLEKFQRLGFSSYPIPLHNLNRLMDLPRSRFHWFDNNKEPTADAHVEDGYARMTYENLTAAQMDALEDVRCTILDEKETVPIREAREAKERAERDAALVSAMIAGMVQIPGMNFRIGKTEVTQAQWEAVMGTTPSHFKGPNRPVENVSWFDCQTFIEKLNGLPEVKSAKLRFRLPTAAEWEYACRAGSTGDWGKRKNGEEGPLETMGWYNGNSGNTTHNVAQKEPNAFGLYDMHGNVWELCEDAGGGDGANRVSRGGCWNNDSPACAAGYRYGFNPANRGNYLGFRLAGSQD